MSVLVLTDAEVRELLDMESCIEAMTGVLAALQREELSMPLRFVFRPPRDDEPDGVHAGTPCGRLAAVLAEGDRDLARELRAGLGSTPGCGDAPRRRDGRAAALLNASAVTEIRTAAVSAVATRLLARPGASVVAVLGAGVQGRSHVEAMRAALGDPEIRLWSRTPARTAALAEATGATPSRPRGGVRRSGRDLRVHIGA